MSLTDLQKEIRRTRMASSEIGSMYGVDPFKTIAFDAAKLGVDDRELRRGRERAVRVVHHAHPHAEPDLVARQRRRGQGSGRPPTGAGRSLHRKAAASAGNRKEAALATPVVRQRRSTRGATIVSVVMIPPPCRPALWYGGSAARSPR